MSDPSRTTRTTRKTKAAAVIASTGILAAGLGYMATANAQPAGCTASSLSNALGTVASQTGGWLSGHPAAEAAVNTADEGEIRNYFATHPAEWAQLQSIASPLRNLRQSCPQQVSPADVARLYDAMAS